MKVTVTVGDLFDALQNTRAKQKRKGNGDAAADAEAKAAGILRGCGAEITVNEHDLEALKPFLPNLSKESEES